MKGFHPFFCKEETLAASLMRHQEEFAARRNLLRTQGSEGRVPFQGAEFSSQGGRTMKRLVSFMAVGILLAGAMSVAQEAEKKTKTYSLVVSGAV